MLIKNYWDAYNSVMLKYYEIRDVQEELGFYPPESRSEFKVVGKFVYFYRIGDADERIPISWFDLTGQELKNAIMEEFTLGLREHHQRQYENYLQLKRVFEPDDKE